MRSVLNSSEFCVIFADVRSVMISLLPKPDEACAFEAGESAKPPLMEKAKPFALSTGYGTGVEVALAVQILASQPRCCRMPHFGGFCRIDSHRRSTLHERPRRSSAHSGPLQTSGSRLPIVRTGVRCTPTRIWCQRRKRRNNQWICRRAMGSLKRITSVQLLIGMFEVWNCRPPSVASDPRCLLTAARAGPERLAETGA